MKHLRRLGWLVLGTALLVVLAAGWLFGSSGGRDFALARAQAALPPDALAFGRSEGTLSGGLRLFDVRLELADFALEIAELELELAPWALAGREVRLRSLVLRDVVYREQASAAPAEPFVLPERLPWPALDLPVALRVDALALDRLDAATAGDVRRLLDRLTVGVRLGREGALAIDALDARLPAGRLAVDASARLAGRPDITLDAQWFRGDETTAALAARARPEGEGVALGLALPGKGRIDAVLGSDLSWRLDADLDDFDAAEWTGAEPGVPIDLALSARGGRLEARVEARVRRQGFEAALPASTLRWPADLASLAIESLRLEPAAGGRIELGGEWRFAPVSTVQLDARLDGLVLALEAASDAPRLDGRLRAQGPLDALQVTLDAARLVRGEFAADVALAAQVGADRARIDQLTLVQPLGRLAAEGELAWSPSLDGTLAIGIEDFDPGLLAADWPGRLQGSLDLRIAEGARGVTLAIGIAELGGMLRGAPLSGSGRIEWRDGGVGGDLALALGDSRLRVRGDPAAELDLRITLDPLRLELLAAGAAGVVSGELRLRGAAERPRVSGALAAEALAFSEFVVGEARIELDVATADPLAGSLSVDAAGLVFDGEPLGTLSARYAGSGEAPGASLQADGPKARVVLVAEGAAAGGRWAGSLVQFDIAPAAAPAWRLATPATLSFDADSAAVAQACLDHAGGGRLCLDAGRAGGGQSVALTLRALPLQALLPSAGLAGLGVDGAAEAELRFVRGSDGKVSGGGRIDLSEGGLREMEAPTRRLLAWRSLAAEIDLQPAALAILLVGEIGETGKLLGEFSGGSPLADAEAALVGRLDAELDDLRIVEHLAPDFAAVQGRLTIGLDLAGRWRAPAANGTLRLQSFAGELPALGRRLRDSELSLRSDGERVDVEGRFAGEGGPLRLTGSIEQAFGEAPRGQFSLQGENFLAVDTAFVRARVSPDLQARWRGERVILSGRVTVPEAKLDLAHLDATVRPSSDVVVIDPAAPALAAGRGPRLSAQVDVAFGERVTLRGFGFDGRLEGALRVSERSGRATTGRGALEVRGRYRAYGQDLDIQRGRLLFSASPIDNPGLDVRAQRKVDDVTVGIEVRGTARQPVLSVWSEPALDQAEAVSYLVLGRPLRAASSADSSQLSAAAASLGGNLLAGPLGERLGFDTFEVADSQSLGGAAFTVGKFLSPSLYLSYGISLFGSGQVLTLRYLLSERLDVEVESGVENRAGINYRVERD